jgi:hypothetical protein
VKVFAAVLLVGAALLASPAVAEGPQISKRTSARAAARLSLGALLTPPDGPNASVRVVRCAGRYCRVKVRGAARCTATVRLRLDPTDGLYVAWAERLRCR